MQMYKILVIVTTGLLLSACSGDDAPEVKPGIENRPLQQDHVKMMQTMGQSEDTRTSLEMSPMQAQHQLRNMRGHVAAVQTIIEHLSRDEFDQAAAVAHAELGLTPEMKMMCSAFGNEEFQRLGFEFHDQADEMGAVFKTRDKNRSLQALAITMNSCVTCHAAFRQ